MDRPQTSYAWNEGTALAYQIRRGVGAGSPVDPWVRDPPRDALGGTEGEPVPDQARGLHSAHPDGPPGLGLSDRLTEIPTLDERVADLMSVLDAAESEHAALFGNADSGPACIAAAVFHPDRIGDLILCGTYAKRSWSEDYSIGWKDDEWARFRRFVKEDWGKGKLIQEAAPSMAHDQAFRDWYATLDRVGAGLRAILLLGEMTMAVDVRELSCADTAAGRSTPPATASSHGSTPRPRPSRARGR